MENNEEYAHPSKLLMGILDTFIAPTCIVDDHNNCIMNELAKELYDKGFDVPGYSSRTKNGSTATFFHKGKKYFINKKDINHGTKSFLCTIELEDETILKLKKSSDKLKEVLSVL
jgi:hypothetical protein